MKTTKIIKIKNQYYVIIDKYLITKFNLEGGFELIELEEGIQLSKKKDHLMVGNHLQISL